MAFVWLPIPRQDRFSVRVGATVSNADETFAAIEDGSGVVLIASGNAAIYRRPGIVTIPVTGLSPSRLALAWRADDHRGVIRDLLCSRLSEEQTHEEAKAGAVEA